MPEVIPSSYRNPEVGFGMPPNVALRVEAISARFQKKEIHLTRES
jgi:hypothetical protein